MSEQLLIAILGMIAKEGLNATISFLKNKGATLDTAIAALDVAAAVSLQDYKNEDAANRPQP